MKKKNGSAKATISLVLLFIVFVGIDLFLLVKGAGIEALAIFGIFTVILGLGIYSDIQRSLKNNKARRLKKKGIAHPVDAKIIRFQLAQSDGEKTDYCFIASDGESEFMSEPFRGEITGYDEERLRCLPLICINYNILDIEPTIKEIEHIQTTEDIMNRWQNHSANFAKLLNSYSSATGTDFNGLLARVRRSEEYLKSQVNNPSFRRSCLECGNHKIFVGDVVKIYVDPSDSSIYRIDTDYLYN